MTLFLILVTMFLVNILFGYWRANTRKFSIQWIMAIHIPVPLAIGLRLWLLGWSWPMLPLFIATFFTGQYAGGKLRNYLAKRQLHLSSCLVMDLVRMLASAH